MKNALADLLGQALDRLKTDGTLPTDTAVDIRIENARGKGHGDFASNLALMLAKPARRNPRELAQALVEALPADARIAKVEIAGPGFINFHVADEARFAVIEQAIAAGESFGRGDIGAGKRVQVEFVSANPTGPLHVGHGRGAAYGATVADLLEAVGYDVYREYYVNDAGRQMDILAASVWLRYLELGGIGFDFPSNGYKGDYVQDIAASLRREHGDRFDHPAATIFDGVPADEPAGGDKEAHIDGLIARCRELLGEDGYRIVFDRGLTIILDDIRDDLGLFGVTYQNWYSERSLMDNGAVQRALAKLTEAGHIYEDKGAQWFRSTAFGDEKDRVVVRDNGQTTYFASDIAYHMEKFERGFEQVIDVWGADHHGYVPRVQAAISALGGEPDNLDVLLVQFAILWRGGERVQMSTRSGSFVTLRQLRKEVGTDAARFFYVMRRCEQHLDFDLDLAKSQSKDNPVYYIQYAHARVATLLKRLDEQGLAHDPERGAAHLDKLGNEHEQKLSSLIGRYPEVIRNAALNREPHQIAQYLRDLANDFHSFYDAHRVMVDDAGLRDARVRLCLAARQVIRNGLKLLGVSAPESM
ncbi:MAG: arginine--tRNA ligase [Gammaproteobacteria bacterium]